MNYTVDQVISTKKSEFVIPKIRDSIFANIWLMGHVKRSRDYIP